MEPLRARRNSTSSIHSQSNLSIASVQCSSEHTHAIVQRHKDKKVILVPLNCFVNFGKTVKLNESATYKIDEDSRKVDRGKVLIFGWFAIYSLYTYISNFIFLLKELKNYVWNNCKF